uniref:Uncharacterized protein n=1 Tax=Zooxanthella nutricula TaxID=1333877 RepID=A0A7S2I8X0_9DINO
MAQAGSMPLSELRLCDTDAPRVSSAHEDLVIPARLGDGAGYDDPLNPPPFEWEDNPPPLEWPSSQRRGQADEPDCGGWTEPRRPAFDGVPDVLQRVLLALEAKTLGAASAAASAVRDASEPAWRNIYDLNWASSLFALKAHSLPSCWRSRCSARAQAQRTDLDIVPGRWRVYGSTEDRKGRVVTEGVCAFTGGFAMQGRASHRRVGRRLLGGLGHGQGESIEGKWSGSLQAHMTPGAGKRLWALGWREKLAGYVGSYDYLGRIFEQPGGKIIVVGEFKILGGFKGKFQFVLERLAPNDGPV